MCKGKSTLGEVGGIMMARTTYLAKAYTAGCFTCGGYEPLWCKDNAQAVAAKHHDSTGHATWCEVRLSYTYGEGNIPEEAERE